MSNAQTWRTSSKSSHSSPSSLRVTKRSIWRWIRGWSRKGSCLNKGKTISVKKSSDLKCCSKIMRTCVRNSPKTMGTMTCRSWRKGRRRAMKTLKTIMMKIRKMGARERMKTLARIKSSSESSTSCKASVPQIWMTMRQSQTTFSQMSVIWEGRRT